MTKEKEETAATTRLTSQKTLNWAYAAIVWYLAGLLLFHALAAFGIPGWDNTYYTWDKSKDCLFLFALYKWNNYLKAIVWPILIYSIIRVCLQIVQIFTETGPNVSYMVTTLFCVALAATTYLTIKQESREWK